MKFLFLIFVCSQLLQAHTFEVTYPVPDKKPVYTPRVYVVVSQGFRSPRSRMGDWGRLPILFAVDDHDRDGKVTIDEKCISSISHEESENMAGRYKVQAVVRIHPDWLLPGDGEGDLYSTTQRIEFVKGEKQKLNFIADQVVQAPKFREDGPVQDHFLKSEKLSAFYKRD